MQINRFGIDGMTCGGCATAVSRAISEIGGVRNVIVSFDTKDATVEYDEHIATPAQLRLAVMSAGYEIAAQA